MKLISIMSYIKRYIKLNWYENNEQNSKKNS